MESPSHEAIIKLFGQLDVGARLEILDDHNGSDGGGVVIGTHGAHVPTPLVAVLGGPLRARLSLTPIGEVHDLSGWCKAVSSVRVQTIVAPAPPPNSELTALASPHSASAKVVLGVSTRALQPRFVTEPTPALHYDISIEYDRMAAAVATAGDATNPSDTALELRVEVSAPPLAQLGSRRAESHSALGGGDGTLGLFLHNLNAESAEVWSLYLTVVLLRPLRLAVLSRRVLSLDDTDSPTGILNVALTNHAPRDVVVTRLRVSASADGHAGVAVDRAKSPTSLVQAPPAAAAVPPPPPPPSSCDGSCRPVSNSSASARELSADTPSAATPGAAMTAVGPVAAVGAATAPPLPSLFGAQAPITVMTNTPGLATAPCARTPASALAAGATAGAHGREPFGPASSAAPKTTSGGMRGVGGTATGFFDPQAPPWLITDSSLPSLLPPESSYAIGVCAWPGLPLCISADWYALDQRSEVAAPPPDRSGSTGCYTTHFWLHAPPAPGDASPFAVTIQPVDKVAQLGVPFAALCRVACTSLETAYSDVEVVLPVAAEAAGAGGPALICLIDRVRIGHLSPGMVRAVRIECVAVRPGAPLLETWQLRVTTSTRSSLALSSDQWAGAYSLACDVEVEVTA